MPPLLQATGIVKQFPGTLALDRVELELRAGEIHAVVGENGAGKSTLMKILCGVHSADAGEIFFEGRRVSPATPREALELGIAIVHQELSLVPPLTVAENIFPGRLPTNALGMVKYGQLFNDAQRALDRLDVQVDPRALVSDISIANQQLVEIAKALSQDCKVLILDEPTSALTEREVDTLFDLLRRLAQQVWASSTSATGWMRSSACRTASPCCATASTSARSKPPDQHRRIIRMMVGRS